MRKSLRDEKSPLDANLESVLPGVHQWHKANEQAISRLGDRVDTFAEAVAAGINTLITKVNMSEQQRADQEARLAALLEMGSNVLRGGQSQLSPTRTTTTFEFENGFPITPAGAPSPAGAPDTWCTTTTVAATVSQEETELDTHKTYRMRPKHQTLTDLYAEWMGTGDFMDEFGGIEGRNQKFGARWRKHLAPYIYSRTERTVKGIRAFAEEKRIDVYDACEQLQEQYKQCKCSCANMVSYFTTIGLLAKKKPRGKVTSRSP